MAQSLTTGWVDTGIRKNYSCSAKVRVWLHPGARSNPIFGKFTKGATSGWTVETGTHNNAPGQVALLLRGVFPNSPLLLETLPLGADPRWSNDYTFTATSGPYRLGVTLETISGHENDFPLFCRYQRLRYAWFYDEHTVWTEGIAGKDVSFGMRLQDGKPTISGPGGFGWTCKVEGYNASGYDVVFTELTQDDGPIDTSALTGVMTGFGGNGIGCQKLHDSPDGDGNLGSGSVSPPYILTEDLRVSRFGVDNLAAIIVDSDGNERTSHYGPVTRVRQNVGWLSGQPNLDPVRSYRIKSSWATAQDPPLPTDDLSLPIQMPPPRGGASTYQPISVTLAPEINVNRPDGAAVPPSQWVSSDTAKLTVAENPSSSVFTVTAAGSHVRRQLVSDWRERVGLIGGIGPSNPKWGVTAYEALRHNQWGNTGEDIWAWPTYAYLRVRINAPVAGELLLQVEGAHLDVDDPHTTGDHRWENMTVTEVPYVKTHVIPMEAGPNEVKIDLLFPEEGGPWYYSRVDALQLSGFEVASGAPSSLYTLSDLSLVAEGNAYLKLAFGKQLQRNDYSALVAAADGSFPFYAWGDQTLKPDETGAYGGGLRYCTIVTGADSGVISDSQLSLAAFWGQLGLLEGWTVTYDQVAHNAAMKDAEGNEFADGRAQWALPIVPQAGFPAGSTYQPPCAVVCGEVQIVNGHEFTIRVDHPLWGALEAVATYEGGRAPGGIAVAAVREDTDEVVAIGTTDAHGYVAVSPVPANGTTVYFLAEA